MSPNLSNLSNLLRELRDKLPKWAKIIVILIIALTSVVYLFTSCGTTTRVSATTTDNSSIRIQVENKSDNDSSTDVSPDIPITIEKTGVNSYRISYLK